MNKKIAIAKNADLFSLIMLALTVSIFLILLVSLNLRSESSKPLEPISIATGEWAPYSGEDLEEYGVASAIVTEVLKEIGYQPKFQFLPWGKSYDAARRGQTNQEIRATFPWRKTEERELDFYYSEPIIEISFSGFYHAEKPLELEEILNSDQQPPCKFLAIDGYTYPKEKIACQKLDNISPNKIDAFTQLVNDKEIKLVIESTEVGQRLLREEFPLELTKDIIRMTPQPLYTDSLYLIASRRNPHNHKFIRQFNNALREMEQDGSLASLEDEITAKIDAMRMVQLQPWTSDGYLNGYLKPSRQQPILLTRGTQAVVEAWPALYLTSYDSSAQSKVDFDKENLVKVRILNGPLSQQVIYVDGRSIYLSK